MQVDPIILHLREAIRTGNTSRVESILEDGFNLNTNISLYKNTPLDQFKNFTALIYTLGYASLPDIGIFGESPLNLQKAKKIVQILLNQNGPKEHLCLEEAEGFMSEMEYFTEKAYAGDHPKIIKDMQKLLDTINKVLRVAMNNAPTFIECYHATTSPLSIFPKEIIGLIAVALHTVVQQSFD